ncbi:uncharacterized protein [Periplaneta americana]|uniref:uncharacterized protein isoform X2 n=1 Tax=Periplaneta americana TaxID=6978 RepID=UPI0037E93DBA
MEKKKGQPLQDQNKLCIFCNLDEDNELLYGKIYELDGDIVTHYYCLLLSSNMEQNGGDNDGILGFLRDDILKEWRRGKRILCFYCKKPGATLGCCVPRCKKVFHLPCGRREGSLHQFFGQFKSFCSIHRPIQKIDPSILRDVKNRDATCTICYDSIEPTASCSTLWAPCCRINAWFHRDCVQRLAMSAGYFFKCPLCNNKSVFQKAMLDFGIYIPEQDASWELVPNAYQELLHRHNRCDALRCNCPKGRQHEMMGTRWELVLCRYCGSQGVHVGCGPLKWSNPEWECEDCKTMLQNAQDRRNSEEDDDEDNAAEEPPCRYRRRQVGRKHRSQSSDSSSCSSQSPHRTLTGGPVSPPTPIAVVDVSDDEVIEIIDDDPPVRQDNRSVILSPDGVAIPVVQISNIMADPDVVGDLKVKIPGQLNDIQQVQLPSHEVQEVQPVRNEVQEVPVKQIQQVQPVRPSPAPATSSSITTPLRPLLPKVNNVDVDEGCSANKRLKTDTAMFTSQPNISVSGQSSATPVGGLLKTYLTESTQRDIAGGNGQTYSQPLVCASSVHANSRRPGNPNSFSCVRHKQWNADCVASACHTIAASDAVPTSTSTRSRDRSRKHRSGAHPRRSDPRSQREPGHSDDRVIIGNIRLSDLKFRILGYNRLQMVFFDCYVVTFDLPMPHLRRQIRKVLNRQSVAPSSLNLLIALCEDKIQEALVTHASSSDKIQEELVTHAPSSDKIQEELVTHAPSSDKIQEELVTHAPLSDKIQTELVTHAPLSDKIQAELVTHAPSSDKIQEELVTHAPLSDKIQTELVTHAPSSDKRQEELVTHASSSDKIQKELVTHASSSDKIQEELVTHSPSSDKIQKELVSHASSSDRIQEELVTHAPLSDKIQEELVTHAFSSDRIQEELVIHASSSDKIQEEPITRAPSSGKTHAPSSDKIQGELINHAPSSNKIQEELVTHIPLSDEIQEELVTHIPLSDKIQEELVTHAPSSDKIQEELVTHAPSDKIQEELIAHALSSDRIWEEVVAHVASSSDRIWEEMVAHAPSSDKIQEELIAHAPSSDKIQEGMVTHAPSSDKVPEELVTHAASDKIQEELIAHSPFSDKIWEEVVAHAPSSDKIQEASAAQATPLNVAATESDQVEKEVCRRRKKRSLSVVRSRKRNRSRSNSLGNTRSSSLDNPRMKRARSASVTSMNKRYSLDPVPGRRSPICTRSRTEKECLNLRRINGRRRLFPSAVPPHSVLLLQNSTNKINVDEKVTNSPEKSASSGGEKKSDSVCTGIPVDGGVSSSEGSAAAVSRSEREVIVAAEVIGCVGDATLDNTKMPAVGQSGVEMVDNSRPEHGTRENGFAEDSFLAVLT